MSYVCMDVLVVLYCLLYCLQVRDGDPLENEMLHLKGLHPFNKGHILFCGAGAGGLRFVRAVGRAGYEKNLTRASLL